MSLRMLQKPARCSSVTYTGTEVVEECHALAHSHFDWCLMSRLGDVECQLFGRGIVECVVMLWRWCGGVVGCVWWCVLVDVVCECGCEFHMELDVLLFCCLFLCI